MSIEEKCKNCKHFSPSIMEEKLGGCDLKCGEVLKEYGDMCFNPKEELIRRDERSKFITLLKSDLENFDGLADDCVVRKDIHELLENNAVRKYIESTIELLQKENRGKQ